VQPTPLFSVADADDEPDASRGAILDGALAAFLDVGVRRTSMGDVARRSRISPATLYRKFAGKSGLVEAVALREVRRFLADMDDTLEATRQEGGNAEEQVITLALTVIDWIRRNRLLRRLLETEPELVLPLLTTQGAPVLDLGRTYVRGVLERLQREGVLPPYDPDPIAETLARLALSLALTPESVLPLDDDAAARALFRAHIVPALGLQDPATTRRSPR
jgi:AcrR family transcriptional regulator